MRVSVVGSSGKSTVPRRLADVFVDRVREATPV